MGCHRQAMWTWMGFICCAFAVHLSHGVVVHWTIEFICFSFMSLESFTFRNETVLPVTVFHLHFLFVDTKVRCTSPVVGSTSQHGRTAATKVEPTSMQTVLNSRMTKVAWQDGATATPCGTEGFMTWVLCSVTCLHCKVKLGLLHVSFNFNCIIQRDIGNFELFYDDWHNSALFNR